MPKWLEERLAKQAGEKGLKGNRRNAYIYGTLSKYEKRKKSKHSRKSAKS